MSGRPHVKVEFEHWSKASYWTLDEGVALLLGMEPALVPYVRVRELVLRAKESGQLTDPIEPSAFLAWARRAKIECPPELKRQLRAYRNGAGDRPNRTDLIPAAAIATPAQRPENICDQATKPERSGREKREAALGTKERTSIQKMLIGMAIKRYRYEPAASRNDATQRIVDDVQRVGLDIDPDTVRKHLRQAADELVPAALDASAL